MSDIVERLKSGTCGQGCGTMTECICATAEDAADEITRLRAEVEKLKAALREIGSITVHSGGDIHGISPTAWRAAFGHAHAVARAALGDTHE